MTFTPKFIAKYIPREPTLEQEERLREVVEVVVARCESKAFHIDMLAEEVAKLWAGIRHLRDEWLRGDNKCWKDIEELAKLLPEGFTPPARDTFCELENCKRYIESCHHPDVEYVSPQVEIERLQQVVATLEGRIRELELTK